MVRFIYIYFKRLFNLFCRLRLWWCEGGVIGVIWWWIIYCLFWGCVNVIFFFNYFDYFFFYLIGFFYLLYVDFGFICIYEYFIIFCLFERDGVLVFCYFILVVRFFYLWEGVI